MMEKSTLLQIKRDIETCVGQKINAFDFDLLYKHLQMLIQGESIKVPEYSFELYGRTGNYEIVVPRPVIIVEGILLFYDERIRNLFDIKIYVDTDADVRILRRLKRDVEKRGRTLDSVIKQYLETVRPCTSSLWNQRRDLLISSSQKVERTWLPWT